MRAQFIIECVCCPYQKLDPEKLGKLKRSLWKWTDDEERRRCWRTSESRSVKLAVVRAVFAVIVL
jgi:hypothetical protein